MSALGIGSADLISDIYIAASLHSKLKLLASKLAKCKRLCLLGQVALVHAACMHCFDMDAECYLWLFHVRLNDTVCIWCDVCLQSNAISPPDAFLKAC